MTLFTHYKQWIQFRNSAGAAVGGFFERISGGEIQYGMAEAAPANSRGMIYRSTRFRISELTLETHLRLDDYQRFSDTFDRFRRDGNQKMTVTRLLRDGEGRRLPFAYQRCSVIQPPLPDDGDVGRDNEFLMMRIRLQPEALWVGDGGNLQRFDPEDTLNNGYFRDAEADRAEQTRPIPTVADAAAANAVAAAANATGGARGAGAQTLTP